MFEDYLTVENVTGVTIGFKAELKPPFYILHKTELKNTVKYNLEKDEKITLCVQFQPDLLEKMECRTIFEVLKLLYLEHPKQVSCC